MLVSLREIFENNKGYATGAFNITNLETLQAAIGAATKTNKGIILNYADAHSNYIDLDTIGPIMLMEAERASVPVCVHLDHGNTRECCIKALTMGFRSVMYDASGKDFETNVAETADMVQIAHSFGATVEAELGHILVHDKDMAESGVSMQEDVSNVYTDPDKAAEFVERTSVDALAIAFGTAHGIYRVQPVLDLDRISLIKEKVNVPLVMHGGSGLTDEQYRTAVRNGIRKINYYTYLSLYGGHEVAKYIGETPEEDISFHDLVLVGRDAMEEKLIHTIETFSLCG